jgi:lysylphosphatidylglycerol synthetase-like protein (DUF2156 family)
MKEWYVGIYKALIMASVIGFLISFFSQGTISYGSMLAGYSVLVLGIMMILLILFTQILKVTQNDSAFQIIWTIFMTSGPFLLMLSIIGFVLYLLIKYKDPINDNHISHSYHTFSNITIILLLLQIYMVYTNIATKEFEVSGKMSKVTSSIIYLLGVLTGICSMIMYIILKFFRTDG